MTIEKNNERFLLIVSEAPGKIAEFKISEFVNQNYFELFDVNMPQRIRRLGDDPATIAAYVGAVAALLQLVVPYVAPYIRKAFTATQQITLDDIRSLVNEEMAQRGAIDVKFQSINGYESFKTERDGIVSIDVIDAKSDRFRVYISKDQSVFSLGLKKSDLT